MDSRIDRQGRTLHYGQVAFDGQCDYEGCKSHRFSGRFCASHQR